MVGGTPALLPDGKIYYQDERHFYALDPDTAKIESVYDKPKRSETQQFDFETVCATKESLIFPLVDYLSDKDYLVFDRIKGNLLDSYTAGNFCQGNYVLSVYQDAWIAGFVVRDAESSKVLWKVRSYFSQVDAVEFDQNTTYLTLRKGTTVSIRAYETNYDSNRFIGDTGKLHWEQTITGSKDAIYLLQKRDQLILSEINLGHNGAASGKVVSINPITGHVNWQSNNAVMMLSRYYDYDGFVYVLRTNLPGVISALDQKTGQEKQRFALKNINYLYGVIVTADQVIFANTTESNNNPFVDFVAAPQVSYNVNSLNKASFISVDKKTGKMLWESDFANLKQLLNYSEGVLYFGGIADNLNKMYFYGGKRKKETNFVFFKRGMIPPNNLMDRAYFIDAASGDPLLTAVLEGNGENFVEKVFMKDNLAFIKSLSGWLYAVEIKR